MSYDSVSYDVILCYIIVYDILLHGTLSYHTKRILMSMRSLELLPSVKLQVQCDGWLQTDCKARVESLRKVPKISGPQYGI